MGCCSRKGGKVGQSGTRVVYVNNEVPVEEEGAEGAPQTPPTYIPNTVKTSKYTLLNFIPKNLFEQFRRVANFYFLCVAVIQLSIESPVSPLTSILPLVFVILVTGVKQGYEDWQRHREDTKVNRCPAQVVTGQGVTGVMTSAIKVGDIVRVEADQEFPCDLVLLTSADPESKCDVTTANLDGETNLKTFVCPAVTRDLDDLSRLRAKIECQIPHANLYEFLGRLEVYEGNAEPSRTSLGTENLLLRGARLKNTPFVTGVAVYTGAETKMALNSKMTSNKFSTVEKSMNYFLVVFLLVLVLEITVSTILKYQLYGVSFEDESWYYFLNGTSTHAGQTAKGVAQDAFSFLVLYNYIIPISLYVTLEVQKFLGSKFLEWDNDLQCPDTRERAKCNTSDLNEDLGQVQYLFSDKTGTLTENVMHFRHCSANGSKYVDVHGELHALHEARGTTTPTTHLPPCLEQFLLTLALCHTVQVTNIPASDSSPSPSGQVPHLQRDYQAASPDEKALVEACARYGVVLVGQQRGVMTVVVRGHARTYTRLHTLEFDSDRKRMSVIVREDATGKVWVLTKGAESSVLGRCVSPHHLHDTTLKHIDHYAMLGLRTLAVARRELTEKEFTSLHTRLTEAREVVEGREEAVRRVVEEVESGMSLLGATGVEDLLQDGVQETLEALRVAGIKVWVLTGDKVETAINIAYSCGHFKRFMTLIRLTAIKDAEDASRQLQECISVTSVEDAHYGLVVDGASLALLMAHLPQDFSTLCHACTAVVCCRMSPKQKAEVVRMVKGSKGSPVCAAVGDGANDVSMIQEAHVGLGLMGKEGRQAVRCADFAFARFRFLRKVLLVHGHWYYSRVSTLVQYSFYKNLVFITPQLLFSIVSAFSTQPLYDEYSLTMYNITYTFLPVLVFGLFEQCVPSPALLARPALYTRNKHNALMSWLAFLKWTLCGLFQTFTLFFGLYLAYHDSTPGLPQGQTADLYLFGTTLITGCVWVVNVKLVLEARFLTQFFFWALVITLVGFSVQLLFFQGVVLPDGPLAPELYWIYYRMYESPALMLALVLLGVTCLLPDLVARVWRDQRDARQLRAPMRKSQATAKFVRNVGVLNEAFEDDIADVNGNNTPDLNYARTRYSVTTV